ncbi:uncharacterized protein LOC144478874 [Augochlora pura]
MTVDWFYVTITAFVVWTCCLDSCIGGPLPENIMILPTRKYLKSSAVATAPVFAKDTKVKNDIDGTAGNKDRSSVASDINLYRLPPSPANLLKPDGFQFYTYNERGDMITKQMTPEEIQALIASGGPDHSNIGIQEPQKAEDILTGGKKVMDVVQKVQNVLKSAMNKPPMLTGTISNSVPEKANVEWSNILPVILAGDKHVDVVDDTRYIERFTTSTTSTVRTSTVRSDYVSNDTAFVLNATVFTTSGGLGNATKPKETNGQTVSHGFGENRTRETISNAATTTANTPTEKLMIPVAVITAQQKPHIWRSTTQSPIFQKITEILSTADNDTLNEHFNDNTNQNTELLVSAILDSTTTAADASVDSEAPKTSGMEENTDDGVTTEGTFSMSSNKNDTLTINASLATTPLYSPSEIVVTAADKADAVSLPVLEKGNKPSVLEIVTSSTSLPMELINSLSSMIGQVSEVSASSVLPISTDFEGQSLHDQVQEKERKNNSDVWKTATAPLIDLPIKLPTSEERIEESFGEITGTTFTKLPQINQDRVTWTIPPVISFTTLESTNGIHSDDVNNFSRVSTTNFDQHGTMNSTLLATDTTRTSTTKELLGVTTDSMPVIDTFVTLQTLVKPFDSTKTNLSSFGSPLIISDVEQQSNIESIAIIEDMLKTVSTEANIPSYSTESLVLPNVPVKTVASGLIAGFDFIGPNTNVTPISDTNTANVAFKLESQTLLSTTETLFKDNVLYELNPINHETRNSSAMNETVYIELKRPSDLIEEPGTLLTTDRTLSTIQTNFDYIQVENETSIASKSANEIPIPTIPTISTTPTVSTVDSSVSVVSDLIGAVVDSGQAPPSEHSNYINYTTTVSSKVSSILFDMINTVQQSATNVDGESKTSIVADLENIPLEVVEKGNETSVTYSGGLDRNLSLESTESTIFDRVSTNLPKPISTTAAETSTDASNLSINETTSVRNSIVTQPNQITVTTYSTNETNSINVDPLKIETTTEPNNFLTKIPLKSNVTSNKLPMNETVKFEHFNLNVTTNTTNDINFDEKWHRITLSETAATLPTKYAVQEIPQISDTAITSTTAAATTTTTTTTFSMHHTNATEDDIRSPSTPASGTATTTVTLNPSKSTSGLDSSIKNASNDIVNFSRLCNELAFKFWIAVNKGLSTGRSLALSPFGMVSLLAMIFLGARGSTSDQMNEVLGLDNVATFNPHLIFQNVTDAVSLARNQGIANAVFVRELFADKVKIRKLLPFYKEQAQQFYEGLVAEVNFATISDLARRRTNLLIRKQTGGRIRDFVKGNAVPLRSPLAAISANVFQTDCNISSASTTGRDGELYFAVSSAHRLRKLIPVPATVWRSNVLAGYEPSLDATAIGLGGTGKLVSTIFVLPGQQGHAAPGDTLDRLEQRLVKGAFRDGTWNKLLKVLIPRRGLELQIPKFSHRSVVNATAALKRMGLDQLFSNDADFKGINGIGNRLFLSDVLQMNLFSTCGDENTANGRHHVEVYPASPLSRQFPSYDDERRTLEFEGQLRSDSDLESESESDSRSNSHTNSYSDSNPDSNSTATTLDCCVNNHPRTVSGNGIVKISEKQTVDRPRLKLDQPFLYFVRHNPTGLILHMGRFNPRLL